jgi:uridylate kinase
MKKDVQKIWVISLGGSRIVPNEVDEKFLTRFKKLIDSHPSKRFVVVTGGGTTARKYIGALRKLDKNAKAKAMAGIAVTRFHARFMARFFGKSANEEIPRNMKKIKNLLAKNQIVFCGGLRYRKNNTSDGTASLIATYLKAPFINLTNIDGLYTSNPKENKKAKQIPKITWAKFEKITSKIKFKAGQHFVLDQTAAKTIQKKKIPTYIVGSITSIDNILKGKEFKGTIIQG